jgi:SAM-dependent methyltransferase
MYPRRGNILWKAWYPLVTWMTRKSGVVFLNYGYAEQGAAGPVLRQEDEADRACIQLYDRVVRPVNLAGLDVLEVSCGHGGGASYVARYKLPRSMCGVDRNGRAVALCRQRHKVEGLTFACGNALALGFADGAFDVVVNVEASHCYPDVPRFLGEVRRVLRPGGNFLYADFRDAGEDCDTLRGQMEASGMEIVACDDISANVVLGMERNHEKYTALIERLVPRVLRGPAMRFAGVKGSGIYEALRAGRTVYLGYWLRKRGGDSSG